MIRFHCEQCGAVLEVMSDAAGKRGKCPACGHANVVPFESQPARSQPAAAPPRPASSAPPAPPQPPQPPQPAAPTAATPPPPEDDLAMIAAAASAGEEPPAYATQQGQASPGSRRRKPRRKRKAIDGNVAAGAGVALILTAVIPWLMWPKPTPDGSPAVSFTFSWQVIAQRGAPLILVAAAVGAWIIGVAAIGISLISDRIGRAIGITVCGAIGVILLGGLVLSRQVGSRGIDSDGPIQWMSMAWSVFALLYGLALFSSVVHLHLRAAVGRKTVVRVIMSIAGGILAVCAAVTLYKLAYAWSQTGTAIQSRDYYFFITSFLIIFGTFAGGTLTLVGGIVRRGQTVPIALVILYVTIALFLLHAMITAVVLTGVGGSILPVINFMIFTLGSFTLLGTGIVALAKGVDEASEQRASLAQPPQPAMAPPYAPTSPQASSHPAPPPPPASRSASPPVPPPPPRR